jgi:hypothetical protein
MLQLLAFGGGLTATMDGGSFYHNAAAVGVIALANTTLNVHGTYLGDNKLDKGALYASWGSTMEITGATLQRNKAKYHGAGLYVVGAKATVSGDSKFDLNVAIEGGGAMHVKFSELTMSSTWFTNNSAPTAGALVVYEGSHLSIEKCGFLENTARIVQPDDMRNYYKLGIGGAMFIEDATAAVVSTIFKENRAVMDGGEQGTPRLTFGTTALHARPALDAALHRCHSGRLELQACPAYWTYSAPAWCMSWLCRIAIRYSPVLLDQQHGLNVHTTASQHQRMHLP